MAAYQLWNRAWAAGHRITAVAARDWHGPEQDGPFPGDLPFTGILADDRTSTALLAGLRAGRVILSNGPVVELRLRNADGLEAAFAEVRDFLDPSMDLVVYAADTMSAVRVAKYLLARGLHARVLEGGWEAWQDARLPTE